MFILSETLFLKRVVNILLSLKFFGIEKWGCHLKNVNSIVMLIYRQGQGKFERSELNAKHNLAWKKQCQIKYDCQKIIK